MDFKHRLISADELRREIRLGVIRPNPFKTKQLSKDEILRALSFILGDELLNIFKNENIEVLLEISEIILIDHLNNEELKPKDLQLNLVTNLIVRFVRAKNLPKANRFSYGENIIRKFKFDNIFKYLLKVAMFDNHALTSPALILMPFDKSLTKAPSLWTVDIKK